VSCNGHLVHGGLPTTVSFIWDMTKQTAETDRLARVVSSSPDGIALVQGPLIRQLNAAGARILGFDDPAQLIGRSLDEVLVADDLPLMRERMRQTAMGRPQTQQVYRVRH